MNFRFPKATLASTLALLLHVPLHGHAEQSRRIDDAAWEYRRVENCGHWIPLECPGAVLAAARAWFARHPLAE